MVLKPCHSERLSQILVIPNAFRREEPAFPRTRTSNFPLRNNPADRTATARIAASQSRFGSS